MCYLIYTSDDVKFTLEDTVLNLPIQVNTGNLEYITKDTFLPLLIRHSLPIPFKNLTGVIKDENGDIRYNGKECYIINFKLPELLFYSLYNYVLKDNVIRPKIINDTLFNTKLDFLTKLDILVKVLNLKITLKLDNEVCVYKDIYEMIDRLYSYYLINGVKDIKTGYSEYSFNHKLSLIEKNLYELNNINIIYTN